MKRNAVCSHTGIFYKKEVLYRVSVSAIYSLFLYNIAIRIKGGSSAGTACYVCR